MNKLASAADSIGTGASSSQIYFDGKSQLNDDLDIDGEEIMDDDYEFSKIPESNEENLKSAKVSAEERRNGRHYSDHSSRNDGSESSTVSSYYYLSKTDADRIRYEK
jgi:hypothetical protein